VPDYASLPRRYLTRTAGLRLAVPSAVDLGTVVRPAATATTSGALPYWWLVPPAAMLATTLWGIARPSYSRDEAATMSAVQRPFGAMVGMADHVDAVHGVYYVAVWPVVHVFGNGQVAARLPSALAMVVAALAVTGLGRRLVSARAGLAAGLVFAIMPQVSYYGQTARPYAMATALAAVASYLLVRALQAAAAGDKLRGWLTGYAVCLAALGYMHLFGLLLVAAHAVPVARSWLRWRAGGGGKSLLAGWVTAVIAACEVVSPVLVAGISQRGVSMNWARAPLSRSIATLVNLVGSADLAAAAGLIVLCALLVSAMSGRAGLRARFPADMTALCVPWLILPPVMLIGASVITPVYVFRYVIFCAPAAALLIGAAIAALSWAAGTAMLAMLAVLAAPLLLHARTADGHGDNLRGVDQIIARDMRPGDALMYFALGEPIEMAYPYGMRQLVNVELGKTPAQSDTLGGAFAPARVVRLRVEAARRIWLVQISARHVKPRVLPTGLLRQFSFKPVGMWHVGSIWLILYAH
jgi:mannosyltransferase